MTNAGESNNQQISDAQLHNLTGLSRSTFGPSQVEDDLESAPGAMYQPTQLLDSEDVEDLEARQTQHTFASSPVTKIAMVTGLVGVLGGFAWIAIHGLLDGGTPTEVVERPKERVTKEVIKDPAADNLRAQLALREQQEQLRELQPKEEKEKEPEKKPKTVKAAPPPRPAPRPKIIRQPAPKREVDPAQEWLKAARLGSYGGVSYDPRHQPAPITAAFPKEKTGEVPRGNTIFASHEQVSLVQVSQVPSQAAGAAFNVKKAITAGTMARAVLTSPVVWSPGVEGSTSFSGQLNDPILTARGEVAVPAGSAVVLELMQAPESGLVLLAVRSVTLSGDGANVQVNVPTHAIQVRGVGNQPLIAEAIETIPDRSGEVDALGVIADSAGAFGQMVGINGVRDLSRVYNRFERANRTRRPYQRHSGVVFQVPAGTEVELFVTQSFGLEQAVSPNSLQLGAPLREQAPARAPIPQSSAPQLELGDPMVSPFQGFQGERAYEITGGVEAFSSPSSAKRATSTLRDGKYEELLRRTQLRQPKHNQFFGN